MVVRCSVADTLEIRLGGVIGGRAVTPRSVDFRWLSPLVKSLSDAATIEADIDTVTLSKFAQRNRLTLALSEVVAIRDQAHSSGASYHFAMGADTADAFGRITAGLASLADNPLVPSAAQKVEEGITKAIRQGLTVQLLNGAKTPVFSESNPPPHLQVHPTRKVESELAIRIIRVGGKKPVARVQLLGSKQETSVSLPGEKSARELGNHLYRDAIISGPAEWVIDPERFFAPTRLLTFKVVNYQLLQPADTESVIDQLTKATRGVWDGVDPTNGDEVENAGSHP